MFDILDFGSYLAVAAVSYLLPRNGYSRLGRSRKTARRVDRVGQDLQPHGGVDEKPASPAQKSFTGL